MAAGTYRLSSESPTRRHVHVQVTSKDNNKWYLVMNSSKDALKSAKGFKYDRNAMTWTSE
jgi:hypothetical protein